ncbi:MAG TPA: hypothetical protein V6C97_32190 [Oculatellaceae cyanobacterium]
MQNLEFYFHHLLKIAQSLLFVAAVSTYFYCQPAIGEGGGALITSDRLKTGIASDITRGQALSFDKFRIRVTDTVTRAKQMAKTGRLGASQREKFLAVAEEIYTIGSETKDSLEKDFCAIHYVELSCLVYEKLTDEIAARNQLIVANFLERRRYEQAASMERQLLVLAQRSSTADSTRLSSYNFNLGITYLALCLPDKAQARFFSCLRLDRRRKRDSITELHQRMMERLNPIISLERGDLRRAHQESVSLASTPAAFVSAANVYSAGDFLWLARFLAKTGHVNEAAIYYALALHSFDTMAHATSLRSFDDGRAVACEGLARVELRRGQAMRAHALRGKIARLRIMHSNWPARLSDADIDFFCLWQHLPNPVDPMSKIEGLDTNLCLCQG